jgi:hypothetical protein
MMNMGCRYATSATGPGRCYELAFAYLLDSVEGSDWALVHGDTRVTPEPIGHAWLRRGNTIFDPVANLYFSVDEYRALSGAREHARYSRVQAAKVMVALNHYGPWGDGVPRRRGERT